MEFNEDKGVVSVIDKAGKVRLVYTPPLVLLPTGKTVIPNLEFDGLNPTSPFISVTLPDSSFPVVIAFGLGVKLPDLKGGIHLSFPSFKFDGKGELENSDSDSDDEKKKKGVFGFGIKAPKFGFGHGEKGEIDKRKVDASVEFSGDVKAKVYTLWFGFYVLGFWMYIRFVVVLILSTLTLFLRLLYLHSMSRGRVLVR